MWMGFFEFIISKEALPHCIEIQVCGEVGALDVKIND